MQCPRTFGKYCSSLISLVENIGVALHIKIIFISIYFFRDPRKGLAGKQAEFVS